MNGRTPLVAVGAVAAAVGLAVALRPSLAAGLDPGRALVTLVALVGLLGGVSAARTRLGGRRDGAVPDPVERPLSVPTPGESFDRRLSALPTRSLRVADRDRDRLRERLWTVAVGVLERHGGLSPAAAREALETGTWTDDPLAAAFFAPDLADRATLTDRLRDALAAERLFARRARAAVDALTAYADHSTGTEDGTADE